MRYLIINADDFGYSTNVNEAVLRAHKQGALTSASLMVAEPGFAHAVEIARRAPALGVGLHVALTVDHALLPASDLPDIVDAQGRFEADPFKAALKYFFSPKAKEQLGREMEAQFARFAQTGLPWSHVDGHQHFHMQVVAWDSLLDLCDAYGVHRLRVPHEELRLHLRHARPDLNTVATLALRAVRRRNLRVLQARRTLGGKPVFTCERVYGQLQTGSMNTEYTLGLLARLHARTSEIYFHPGTTHARQIPLAAQRDGVRDVELQALLDPAVRAEIERLQLRPGTYAQVEEWSTQPLTDISRNAVSGKAVSKKDISGTSVSEKNTAEDDKRENNKSAGASLR